MPNLNATQRKSAALALVCCRVMIGLGAVLLAWSLFFAPPGEIAMLTALVATGGILRSLYKPSDSCQMSVGVKMIEPANKGYVATALATVTLAYMPLYFGVSWIYQFRAWFKTG